MPIFLIETSPRLIARRNARALDEAARTGSGLFRNSTWTIPDFSDRLIKEHPSFQTRPASDS
ncbi:hypothetical protein, partial [Xanthomonas euvesicatoria]|uniref:hypothetical protein n=1 Tax=Xanthomonas euvesicatoria TaxID=456327 RepID=UPI001C487A67